jgi:hypothetical protein
VDVVESDLGTVSSRVDVVEASIGTVSSRVDVVEASIGTVSSRVDVVETDLGTVSGRVNDVEADVAELQNLTNDYADVFSDIDNTFAVGTTQTFDDLMAAGLRTSDTNVVVNGEFDSTISGWTSFDPGLGGTVKTPVATNGILTVLGGPVGASCYGVVQSNVLTEGHTYRADYKVIAYGSAGAGRQMAIWAGSNLIATVAQGTSMSYTSGSVEFIAGDSLDVTITGYMFGVSVHSVDYIRIYDLSEQVIIAGNEIRFGGQVVTEERITDWQNLIDQVSGLNGSTSTFDAVYVLNTNSVSATIVTNGTFTGNDDGWDATTAYYAANRMYINLGVTGTVSPTVALDLTLGKTYRISMSKYGSVGISIEMGGNTKTISESSTGDNLSVFIGCSNSSNDLTITMIGGASAGGYIDNAAVQQVLSGELYVAGDAWIGGDLTIGNTNSLVYGDGTTLSAGDVIELKELFETGFPADITDHNLTNTSHSALFSAARTNATHINGVPVATVTAGAAAGATADQPGHTQAISTVTGLQAALDGKAATNEPIAAAHITDTTDAHAQSAVDAVRVVTNIAASTAAGTQTVAFAWGESKRVRILATNSAVVVKLDWPAIANTNRTRFLRAEIWNPNLRSLTYADSGNWASNTSWVTTAPPNGKYRAWSVCNDGDEYEIIPIGGTNATERGGP